jgi:hypothetical protein
MEQGSNDRIVLTEEEKRRQRIRSIMIGFSLAGVALLFFLVTLVRLGSNVAVRPL